MRMEVPSLYSSTHLSFVERYVLTVVYFALGGRDWTHQVNFLSATHVCTWYEDFRMQSENEDLDGEYSSMGIHACRRVNEELVPYTLYLRK
jgi:hypothetical protein